MDTKGIITRIISDAEEKANSIISVAEEKAKKSIDSANEWCENYKSAQQKILDAEIDDILSRRQTVAELDCRKIKLSSKQQVITEVFERVYDKLCSLPKEDYLNFLEKLLNLYAEEGDLIINSASKKVTEQEILSLETAKKLNLKCQNTGDFVGGIMLVNKLCDKDLTFKTIIGIQKSQLETYVATKLFS